MVSQVNSDDGTTSTASANAGTNFAAPTSITTQSYATTVSYTPFLGVAQTNGSNGEQLSLAYDTYGRPLTGTSPYTTSGTPTVTYSYSGSGILPAWQQKTGPDGITTTTLDGFGHTIRAARGDSSSVQSYTDTVYAPCACSPLGKIQKVSQPYAPGGTPAWTTYTYDGMGRTLSTVQPDGASTTTYAYAGSQTKVTSSLTA